MVNGKRGVEVTEPQVEKTPKNVPNLTAHRGFKQGWGSGTFKQGIQIYLKSIGYIGPKPNDTLIYALRAIYQQILEIF